MISIIMMIWTNTPCDLSLIFCDFWECIKKKGRAKESRTRDALYSYVNLPLPTKEYKFDIYESIEGSCTASMQMKYVLSWKEWNNSIVNITNIFKRAITVLWSSWLLFCPKRSKKKNWNEFWALLGWFWPLGIAYTSHYRHYRSSILFKLIYF